MGAGKSTIGRLVAEAAGYPFVDLDSLIEASAGRAVSTIFETEGEESFRRWESDLLPVALRDVAVVALGGGAPGAEANWQLIQKRALSVWIDTPFERVWARIGTAAGRPLLRHVDRDGALRLFESRQPRYRAARYRVDGARPPDRIAAEVLRLWIG